MPAQGLTHAAPGLCCRDMEEGKSLRSSRGETLSLDIIIYSSIMSRSERLK